MEIVFGYVYIIEMKSWFNIDLFYVDILNNSYDFEGFIIYKVNIIFIIDNFILYFLIIDGYFLVIVYVFIIFDCFFNFFGYERYQVYDNVNKLYKVYEDRYYYDIVDDMYYYVVYDDGLKKILLFECQFYDIGLFDYEGVQIFGGIIIFVEIDFGLFIGLVDEFNILYVCRSK